MSRKIPARSTINAIIAAIFPNFQRFDRPDEGKCDGSMVSTVMRGRGGPPCLPPDTCGSKSLGHSSNE